MVDEWWTVTGSLGASHTYITYVENRYATRGIAEIRGCGVGRVVRQCHRIKKTRGQSAGNTPTALTRPASAATGREGQAVQKPRSSLYATDGGLAVMSPGRYVTNLTVLVLA